MSYIYLKSKGILLFLTVLLFSIPSSSYSTHIVGGELNYTCLGGNQYQIKLRVYRDCYTGVPPFDNPAAVGIFDNNNVLITTVYLNFPGSTVLPATVAQADVCVKTPTNICVEVAEYVGTVTLAPRAGGYQLAYQRCCRNPTVDNITNPGSQGATYYARIPDQAVACNSNPVFTNWPPIFVCANNPIVFDHSATDADGDVIVYSLCSPMHGGTSSNAQPQPPSAPPYNFITWKAPYSATNPLGGNTLTIDPNTGLMSGTPGTLGQFVVGVCADEYRNGVLISTTKRDFQFNVINCQPDIVAASVHAITNCTNHIVSFTNNSTGTNNFFWDFGDLTSTSDTSRLKSPTYTYPALGTYTVTLIAFSGINSKCNDTLKNYVVTVTECPPCTMTLATSKVDATCGSSSGASGCIEVTYTSSCTAGQTFSINYAGSSASSSCGGGTATAGGGFPAPTTAILTVNGVVLPPPTFPPQTYVQLAPTTQATCPRYSSVTNSGGVITYTYNLWMGSAASPGSATVTPSGGTGPYTYSWAPSGGNAATAGGLTAGTYTVTVTDASGCQKTGSVIINSTSGLTVTTGVTAPTTCSGVNGSATVTASGGVGPYTYLWSNGQTTTTATGLSVGVYTVNVLDNGCSVTSSITIPPPLILTVGTSRTHARCNGNNGTITANPSGGSGTYTYLWNDGKTTATVSNLTAGTYTVTVTDANGCKGTASANVNDNSLTLTSSFTNPVCGGTTGGTATITATGGTVAYNYSWNSSPVQTTATATGLSGGDYIGTVTDGAGCTDTVMISINEPSELLPEPKNTSTINCAGATTGSAHVDVSGGVPGFTYLWSDGQTTQDITGLSAGTYTVTVTDSKGCTGVNSVVVTHPSPLSLTSAPTNITTCVGDNTGALTVNPSGGNPGYTYSWATSPVQTTQNISGLTAGTYTVLVTDLTGCTATLNATVSEPAPVTMTTDSVPVGCVSNNGSVSVTASGGTGAYTYSWSNGVTTGSSITGLSAGTYSVTVTDANGCTGITSVTVINASAPTVGISGTPTNVNCTGSATGSATVTATGGTGTLTYSWNNGVTSTTGTAGGLTAGTYQVTVTDANGCTATQAIAITQPASVISSSISGQGNVNCTGNATGSATVTAAGGTPSYTYNWSNGVTTSNSVTGLTAGTYTVLVTDANGCTASETVAITQPASAISSSISGQGNVNCTGSATGTATVTTSGGTPSYTYNWSNGVTTSNSVTGLTAGTYTVLVTDANGCTASQTVSITQPVSGITAGATSVDASCGASNGTATVTASGGTGLITFVWSDGQSGATATNLSAGSYTVTATDANGCTQNALVNVNNAGGPTIGLLPTTNVNCTGDATGSATVTTSGGTGVLTYSWNNGVTSTTGSATGLTAGTYIVTVTDINNCSAIQNVTITEPASVAGVSVTSQNNVGCIGSSTGSATVTGTGGTPGYSYNWSSGPTTNTITGLSAGTYSVTVTDSNGCSAMQTITITQPASAVTATTASVNAACGGSNGTATVTASGGTPGYLYSWSPNSDNDSSATGLSAGSYTVLITDQNGCTNTASVTVGNSAGPTTTIVSQLDVKCFGAATGSATVTGVGGTPQYTYNWSNGVTTSNSITGLTTGTYSVIVSDSNGCSAIQTIIITQPASTVSPAPSSTNAACGSSNGTASITASGGTPLYSYNWFNGQTNATITGLTAGSYTVIVTDANGCSQTATATVAGSPGPSIAVSTKTDITCNGLNNGTATVNATSGTTPYTYTWNPNVGNSNSLTGLSANTYTITVTDSAGCSSTTQVTITQPAPFTLTVSSALTLCAGESVTLTATPNGGKGPFTYIWTPAGPVVAPLIPTTYKVTGVDSSGCLSTTDSITVTPLPSPIAGFDTLSSGLFHQSYTFTDLSTGAITWYWDFGDGTTSTLQHPFHTYPAGTYTVTQIVTNTTTGCADTITKVIVIPPNIAIPNVFTPNGDGINDEFWIPNTGFESFELTIYNRWGLKLFSTNSGEIRWDGHTAAGEVVPDGTYYYLLSGKLTTEDGGWDFTTKGFINLNRGGGK